MKKQEIVKRMEKYESWTLNQQDVLYFQLLDWIEALKQEKKFNIGVKDYDIFLKILAYLKSGMALDLLSAIQQNPRNKILSENILIFIKTYTISNKKEITPEMKLFLTRLQILVKYECYQLLFGEKRRKMIIKILDEL